VKAVAHLGDFRYPYGAAVEICGALIKHPLQHKGDRDTGRGQGGRDTPSGGDRQLEQRLVTAEAPALGLIKKLAPQMRGRDIYYRFGQLKSRRSNSASNLIPDRRKLSSAPSRRSTTVTTLMTVH